MDARKRLKLVDVGYVIGPSCGRCGHAIFREKVKDWGVCSKHSYDHEKHGPRLLTVNRLGSCPDFLASEYVDDERLSFKSFREFIKP